MKRTFLAVGLALAAPSLLTAQPVTDAQIAAIVVTANQVDIDAGKYAQTASSNSAVKAFAERMVTDHTSVNKAASDLVAKLNVKPEENDTSRALKAGGEKNLAHLKTLTPGAQNAELKALLVKVRPAFVAHLEHAKHLQASVGN